MLLWGERAGGEEDGDVGIKKSQPAGAQGAILLWDLRGKQLLQNALQHEPNPSNHLAFPVVQWQSCVGLTQFAGF
jgi:hypothetical protein